MVLLHVKKGEDINFLYRTPVTTSNDDATREVNAANFEPAPNLGDAP